MSASTKKARSACTACYQRKVRCPPDLETPSGPCLSCQASQRPCEYIPDRRPGRPSNASRQSAKAADALPEDNDQLAEHEQSDAGKAMSCQLHQAPAAQIEPGVLPTDFRMPDISWEDMDAWHGDETGTYRNGMVYTGGLANTSAIHGAFGLSTEPSQLSETSSSHTLVSSSSATSSAVGLENTQAVYPTSDILAASPAEGLVRESAHSLLSPEISLLASSEQPGHPSFDSVVGAISDLRSIQERLDSQVTAYVYMNCWKP